ncbi:MAG TPA: hypothetical protein VNE41_06390 [Chitinophagaceae bacterium]|nr:hypothetical protein [Chitinophagaceae bacterium]
MSQDTMFYFSLAILIAAIIALVRFRNVDPLYRPFLILVWVASLTEIISHVLAKRYRNDAISNNIYTLAECMLYFWQFRNWGFFSAWKKVFSPLLAVFIIAWLVENLILSSPEVFNSFFPVLYSGTLVLMAIRQISILIVEVGGRLLTNARFLICSGIIIFFTYTLLVKIFVYFDAGESREFLVHIYYIIIYVNLFVNLLFAFAILWMPRKPNFISRY